MKITAIRSERVYRDMMTALTITMKVNGVLKKQGSEAFLYSGKLLFFAYSDADSAPPFHAKKHLLIPLRQRYNTKNRGSKLTACGASIACKKPLSAPCHKGVQKAVFDHMFDYRQPWCTWEQWTQELQRASVMEHKRL